MLQCKSFSDLCDQVIRTNSVQPCSCRDFIDSTRDVLLVQDKTCGKNTVSEWQLHHNFRLWLSDQPDDTFSIVVGRSAGVIYLIHVTIVFLLLLLFLKLQRVLHCLFMFVNFIVLYLDHICSISVYHFHLFT